MDQFEAARLKHQKNLERKLKYQENAAPQEGEQGLPRASQSLSKQESGQHTPAEAAPEVPMEKVTAAIIEVKVTLPTGEFGFRLVKPAVMQNANPSRLTKNAFKNCVLEGLRPLLGGLNDLP